MASSAHLSRPPGRVLTLTAGDSWGPLLTAGVLRRPLGSIGDLTTAGVHRRPVTTAGVLLSITGIL